jgi:RNA polymerase sigma factor (sigma-70 family)
MSEKAGERLLSDEEFSALQAGDPVLFKKVYDAYCGLIQFIVSKCGIGPDQRDDVVQDVFEKFFRGLNSIQGPEKIKSWLCVAARNRSIDKLRAVRKGDPDALEHLTDENQAYVALRREIELQLVTRLVEQIGEEAGGQDFVAFYCHGKSVKEIAAKNGEAVSTVTTRLTRLRRKFGEMIRQLVDEVRNASLM